MTPFSIYAAGIGFTAMGICALAGVHPAAAPVGAALALLIAAMAATGETE